VEDNSKYWVLILGGSSGLGLATAKKMAAEGFNICVLHRDRKSELININKEFESLKQYGVNIVSHNMDALKAEKRTAFLNDFSEQLPKGHNIKVLVHSIAKGNLKAMKEGDQPSLASDDFRITIEAMGISLYDWTKAIVHQKLFSDDARVISFTSEGSTRAWKNYAAVSAAKATLEAITRNIALEFASIGIRANCIQAGMTDTSSFRMIPGADRLKENVTGRNPFCRMTQPKDIADVVYLLSRPEAAWINGAVIPVDGGESIC